MIVNADNGQVIGDVSGAVSATIAATKEAFEVLSQRLYKYSERAVIREWFCNALDAHADADNLHTPIEITLPTELHSVYTQRDYGVGLDADGVAKYIAGYFKGNKAHTNERIGGFGLGAKSPFGYTQGWTLTTYKDGIRYTFAAFVGDNGPQFLLTDERETDEPNGVKIEIPVKTGDIKTWHREAEYVLRRFKNTPPKINAEFEYVDDFDEYSVEDDLRDRHGVYAIMAGVQYPIPPEFIEGTWLETYSRAYIKFENGELTPMPSREELSLTPRTKENLERKIKHVCDKMIAEACTKIDEGKTLRERCRLMLKEHTTSQIQKLPERYALERDYICNIERRRTKENGIQFAGKIATIYQGRVRSTGVKYTYSGAYRVQTTTDRLLGLRYEKLRILIDDTGRGVNLFLEWLARNNPELCCNILRVKHDGINTDSTIEYFKKWFDESEIEVYTLSDYKEQIKRKSVRTKNRVYGSTAGQPNVTFVTGEGRESRFLTAKEVRELDLPYIVQYNGEMLFEDRSVPEIIFRNMADFYELSEKGYVIVYGSARKYIEDSKSESLADIIDYHIRKEVNAARYKTLDYSRRRGNCELLMRCGSRIRSELPEIYADFVGKSIDFELTERLEYWVHSMSQEDRDKWTAKIDSKVMEIQAKVDKLEHSRPLLFTMLRHYPHYSATTKGKGEIMKYYKVKL